MENHSLIGKTSVHMCRLALAIGKMAMPAGVATWEAAVGPEHPEVAASLGNLSTVYSEQGRYQAFFLAWSGRVDPDGNLYIFHRTKAPQNSGGYSNPEVDRWLDEARVKSTLADRKAVYEKITEKLMSEGSIIYLYHRLMIIAHTAKLDGYQQMPDGLIRLTGTKLKP